MKKNIQSKCQVLITGVYRSGSEYLCTLINTHPNISSTMYRVNFMRYIFNKYNLKNEKINYDKIISDLSSRLKIRYKKNINEKKYKEIIKGQKYGDIYDSIMTEMYLNNKQNIWAEKNQLQWRDIPNFLKIMTNGKVIHILRDPRAVMCSYKKFTYHLKPAYLGSAFNSVDAMYHITSHIKKYKKSFLFIKYEDLIYNKKKTLDKVWKFLNLKKTNYIDINNLNDGNKKKWIKNTTQLKGKFDEKLALNSWKKELSKDEINFAETVCHKYMKKFDYEIFQPKLTINHSLVKRLIKNDTKLKTMYKAWYKSYYKLGVQSYPMNPILRRNWDKNS